MKLRKPTTYVSQVEADGRSEVRRIVGRLPSYDSRWLAKKVSGIAIKRIE